MTTRQRGWYWPWLIAAALLFTVAVNVVMVFAATSDRSGSVVEPDYYRKAVAWDQTMVRRAESERLGWRATAALERISGDSARLTVLVTGRDGLTVRGARLTVAMIHNREADRPVHARLAESPEGAYEATVGVRRSGMWEVRVDGRRGAERFVTSVRTEAFIPPAAVR